MRRAVVSWLFAVVFLCNAFVAQAADKHPGVTIYATGGTIAGSAESSTDTTTYQSGVLGVDVLIKAVPQLKDIADVSGVQIAKLNSPDVSQAVLLKLSKEIGKKLAEKGTHGVVVTHGTDTLEETAFFLDLTIKSKKPVVIVGAMRPATAISADGPMNLLQAVSAAVDRNAEDRGVLVVMNDRIGSAFYITKTNATTPDTFKAAEQGFLGTFVGDKAKFYYEPAKPVNKPHFDVSKLDSLPKVVILYSYQDEDVALLDAAVANGAKGIVFAGTGNGSLSKGMEDKVVELMGRGIPVIRSTRTGSGWVSDIDTGIPSGCFNAQKSRILLTLALAEGANMDKIKRYFGM